MRTKLLIIALCLSAFFLFVIFGAISSLPADIAVSHMSLPKSVKITGATGTVQNGFAERVRSGAFSVSNVSWSSGGLIDINSSFQHFQSVDFTCIFPGYRCLRLILLLCNLSGGKCIILHTNLFPACLRDRKSVV